MKHQLGPRLRIALFTISYVITAGTFVACADAPGAGSETESLATGSALSATLVTSTRTYGYCARVTVKNSSSVPTTSWTVAINLNQSQVTTVNRAVQTTSGSTMTVTPRPSNASIAAGSSTSFTFCANSTGSNAVPAIVSVSGVFSSPSSGSGGTGGTVAGTGGTPAGTGGTPAGTGGTVAGTGGTVAGTGGTPAGTGGTVAGTGGSGTIPSLSPTVSSVSSAAQVCLNTPMPTTGTIYYACDCQSGADPSCKAGSDSNTGTDPSKPWQSYDKLQSAFTTMKPGDTVAFCRGGSWKGDVNNNWVNPTCKASTPCTIRDYTPSGGSSTLPLPMIVGGAFNLMNNGNATHEEGYRIMNIALDGAGYTIGVGLAIGNDITDVYACNLSLTNFQIGAFFADSNPPNPGSDGKNARITLRGSQVFNNSTMGYLGACTDCAIEYNRFDHNGDATMADHDIYVQGAADGYGNRYVTTRERIVGNELYHSSQGTGTSCWGDPLVVHGQHDNLLIANNLISQDLGTAQGGCWGIAVTKGYAIPEGFTNVTISGNVVKNVGNVGIMVAYCQNCLIENNLIIQGQTGFNSVGIMAHYNGSVDPQDVPMNAVQILNNTIYLQTTATDSGGIQVGLQGTNHVIANNVILGSTPNMLHCLSYDLSPSAYTSDYNVCWNLGGSVTGWESVTGTSLANWQSKSGLDLHSKTVNPMLKAPALTNYDFSPAAGSPLIGGALSLATTVDITGAARPTPADIGAYQH